MFFISAFRSCFEFIARKRIHQAKKNFLEKFKTASYLRKGHKQALINRKNNPKAKFFDFRFLFIRTFAGKRKIMLIYNTTYHVELADARNFVIWLHECYIPEAEKSGELKNPRVLRILSHKEQDSECFSVQWEVADSAVLHRWHTQTGARLNEELMKTFKDRVIGFPTLMEVIE